MLQSYTYSLGQYIKYLQEEYKHFYVEMSIF